MDAALARMPECVACNQGVDENDATRPYTIVKGEHVHLKCSAVTELSAVYAKEVRGILTVGINSTRLLSKHPLLSEEEAEELLEAYLLGTPAREFALRIANRDVGEWEAAADPYPQREFPTAENE